MQPQGQRGGALLGIPMWDFLKFLDRTCALSTSQATPVVHKSEVLKWTGTEMT